jgi:hypothetical protein
VVGGKNNLFERISQKTPIGEESVLPPSQVIARA